MEHMPITGQEPEVAYQEPTAQLDAKAYKIFAEWIRRNHRGGTDYSKYPRISPGVSNGLINGTPILAGPAAFNAIVSDDTRREEIRRDVLRMQYETGLCIVNSPNSIAAKQLVVGCPAMAERFMQDEEELPPRVSAMEANANDYVNCQLLETKGRHRLLILPQNPDDGKRRWSSSKWSCFCEFDSKDAAAEMMHDLHQHLQHFGEPVTPEYTAIVIDQFLNAISESREKTKFGAHKYGIGPGVKLSASSLFDR